MANVSLDKDLFYQYMINNNSTSTMLNALSGNTNTGVQSANDLSSVLGALQNSASFGTGSISDVSTLLSGLEGISTTGTGNSFSDILQSYLQPTSDRHRRQIVCSILMVWSLLTICRQNSRQRLPVRVFRQHSRHTLTVYSMISTRSKNSQIKWWNRRWEKLFIDR